MASVTTSDGLEANTPSRPRLTRRQMALVHDLARGHDILTVAKRRGCGVSATYELAGRICDRAGLSTWQEIGPWAVESGLVGDGYSE